MDFIEIELHMDGSIGVNEADLAMLRQWCKEHDRFVQFTLKDGEQKDIVSIDSGSK